MAQERHYDMKDSGVEWIGEIPEHWCVKPQKRVVLQCSGGAWGDDPMNDEHDCFCMRIADFDFAHGRFKNTLTENLTKRNYENSQIERLSLQHGDLLIEKSGGGEKTPVGRSVVFDKDYKALFANFMDRLRCDKEQVNPWFFGYWWRTLYFKNITVPYIKQTTGLQNLDISELLDKEQVLLPPLPEQTAIVAYLDEKCAAIDSIIAEAKATIEEYKAWKTSVIFEAVTKGLDPNAEMKDSGVEWIGEIPMGWLRDKINRIYDIIGSGTTPKFDDAKDNSGPINWIQSGDVYLGGDITKVKNQIAESFLSEYSALKFYKPPFVVIAMYGASIGNMAISHISGCVNQACCVLGNPRENFNYTYYALQALKRHLLSSALGGGQPNISQQIIKAQWLPVPPLPEQTAIADYLDSKCASIDAIIAEKETLIAELEAYKKSLIFETVTGKRRVC